MVSNMNPTESTAEGSALLREMSWFTSTHRSVEENNELEVFRALVVRQIGDRDTCPSAQCLRSHGSPLGATIFQQNNNKEELKVVDWSIRTLKIKTRDRRR